MGRNILFALIFLAIGFLIGLYFTGYNGNDVKVATENKLTNGTTSENTAGNTKNKNPKALTVASFIQDWLDSQATLSLKNNTSETIHSFKATIIYKDMKGNVLDYQEISKRTSIAPQMTKTFKIGGFGHDNHYAYYKSERSASMPDRVFQIEFKLNSYK
ncbi:MAG: hypothetical protein IJ681_01340 [Bacteroidales bacterium]|nr:hypothetical protein [Bacteroidales bacterium]